MFFDIENVTNKIYAACTDFDASDYAETKEKDLQQLKYALECVHDYSYYNEHFKVLAEALSYIFDN